MSSTDVAKDIGWLLLSVPRGVVKGVVGMGQVAVQVAAMNAKFAWLGPAAPLATGAVMGIAMVGGVAETWHNRQKLWDELWSDPNKMGEFIGQFVPIGAGAGALASKFKFGRAAMSAMEGAQSAMSGAVRTAMGAARSKVASAWGGLSSGVSGLWGRASAATRRIVAAPALMAVGVGPGGGILPKVASRTAPGLPPKLGPSDFGVKAIADDPELLRMWIDSQKHMHAAPGKGGDAYRAYLNGLESGNATGALARDAFDLVAEQFRRRVEGSGKSFQGYSFERIHHWEWPIGNHVLDALNPKKLFPVTHGQHMQIHRATTIGPHPTNSPINPRHSLGGEPVTPLPDGYFP
jgi:hypothetical protein